MRVWSHRGGVLNKNNGRSIPYPLHERYRIATAMTDVFVVSCVYLVIIVYICEHGSHMSSAQPQDGHDAVAEQLCVDLPSICPCNARILQVVAGSVPLVCGASQTTGSLATLPHIKPPNGAVIDEVFLTRCCTGYVR